MICDADLRARIIEVNVAIIVACTPCFPAFFTKARMASNSVLSFVVLRVVGFRQLSFGPQQSKRGRSLLLRRKRVGSTGTGCRNGEGLEEGVILESRLVRGFGRLSVTGSGNAAIKHGGEDQIDLLREAGLRRDME